MPRKARLLIPGAIHHVMAHGIDGRKIFIDDEDRSFFVLLLAKYLDRSGHRCYAWVVMENHYHLLLRTNEEPLGIFMRRLNTSYAMYYQKRYKRRGYVFQNRYKSIVTQDQYYIEQLVRYVHLNPIRAGICKTIEDLDRYPWIGHSVLVGLQENRFQNKKDILKRFTVKGESTTNGYRKHIVEGIEKGENVEFLNTIRKSNKGSADKKEYQCWVIGDQEFVKKAIENDTVRRLKLSEYGKNGVTVEKIAVDICRQMGITYAQIYRRARNNEISALRKIVAALSHRQYGIPLIQVAEFFRIQSPAVSRMLNEGERLMKQYGITTVEFKQNALKY
ncbi:transposase [bacterium]|nr:transposase [candidate division CSSED10-310 bacterium]